MSKTRKYPAAEEKALIVKRYLVEKVPMSDLCDGDEGFTVQLTDNADLEPFRFSPRGTHTRWVSDAGSADAAVSFVALRWDPATGQVVKAGIYAASIVFDASGDVLGLLGQPDPDNPAAEVDFFEQDGDEDGIVDDYDLRIEGFDWAPDGTRLVHDDVDGVLICVVDLLSGQSTVLAPGAHPAWSPDGTLIAFSFDYGIETIAPDGGNHSVIIPDGSSKRAAKWNFHPQWSPDSGYLIYEQYEFDWRWSTRPDLNVYRATKTGGNIRRLTSDDDSSPVAWR